MCLTSSNGTWRVSTTLFASSWKRQKSSARGGRGGRMASSGEGGGYGPWCHFLLSTGFLLLSLLRWFQNPGCCSGGGVPGGFLSEARSLRGMLSVHCPRVPIWPLLWHRAQWWHPWVAVPRWWGWGGVHPWAMLVVSTIWNLEEYCDTTSPGSLSESLLESEAAWPGMAWQ